MYQFKITELKTNDGTTIKPKKINIIVGPNSSGKSRFLKEIKMYLDAQSGALYNGEKRIVKEINYTIPQDVKEFIKSYNLNKKIINNANASMVIKNYDGIDGNITTSNNLGDKLQRMDITLYGDDWQQNLEEAIESMNSGSLSDYEIKQRGDIPEEAKIIKKDITSKTEINVTYEYNGEERTKKIIDGEGESFENLEEMKKRFLNNFGRIFFAYLGTEEKLLVCKLQRSYSKDDLSLNLLSAVKENEKELKKLADYSKELFGKDVCLDITSGNKIFFRVGKDLNFYRNGLRFDTETKEKFENYPKLDDEGDGIKNFVSTFLSLKCLDKNIILIDEPESFLHPPLARKFGSIIANETEENQQVFIATHSEDFLTGVISKIKKADELNIIRITRDNDKNIIKLVDDKTLEEIKENAMVKSSNILKGLFTETAYTTESFADSVIYQSIIEKCDNEKDFYFVNTQGKDNIDKCIKLYDSLGVKNYAVYDFDFFNKTETISKALTIKRDVENKSMREKIENPVINNVQVLAKKMEKYIKEKLEKEIPRGNLDEDKYEEKIKKCKDNIYYKDGIRAFDEDESLQKEILDTIAWLKTIGIIVIKTGCLETTLKEVGLEYTKKKTRWYNTAISKIQEANENELKNTEVFKSLQTE